MGMDVTIVGASVAGLSTAMALIEKGIKSMLIERKKTIGIPVQCAEYVPAHFLLDASIGEKYIAQSVNGMEMLIEKDANKEYLYFVNSPGVIINRDKWEQFLALEVIQSGSTIITGENVESFLRCNDGIRICTSRRTIDAKILVGADGPASVVARWMGANRQPLMPALQWTVPLKKPIENTAIMFHRDFVGGYGWLFPKGDFANIGVGALNVNGDMLNKVMHFFSDKIIIEALGKTGGNIPIGGMRGNIVGDKILLVGDAAGLTDPISGAGIANAWESGRNAANAIANILTGKSKSLDTYRREMRFIRNALSRAYMRRQKFINTWSNDAQEFAKQIRIAWNIERPRAAY